MTAGMQGVATASFSSVVDTMRETGRRGVVMAGSNALISTMSVGLMAAVVLTGCASRSSTAAGAHGNNSVVSRPTSASLTPRSTMAPSTAATPTHSGAPTASECSGRGSGFDLVLVASSNGAPDPVAAAQAFVLRGGMPGYGTPSSVWQLTDPGRPPVREATVVDGNVSLRAVQFRDGTWAID